MIDSGQAKGLDLFVEKSIKVVLDGLYIYNSSKIVSVSISRLNDTGGCPHGVRCVVKEAIMQIK